MNVLVAFYPQIVLAYGLIIACFFTGFGIVGAIGALFGWSADNYGQRLIGAALALGAGGGLSVAVLTLTKWLLSYP